jgi:hypothetical protein
MGSQEMHTAFLYQHLFGSGQKEKDKKRELKESRKKERGK